MDKKVRNVKIITIVTMIIMFVCVIILTFQLVKINNLKKQTTTLESQKERLIDDIYNYSTANNYYTNNSREYLENYAREELGWGQSDETWYVKKQRNFEYLEEKMLLHFKILSKIKKEGNFLLTNRCVCV